MWPAHCRDGSLLRCTGGAYSPFVLLVKTFFNSRVENQDKQKGVHAGCCVSYAEYRSPFL